MAAGRFREAARVARRLAEEADGAAAKGQAQLLLARALLAGGALGEAAEAARRAALPFGEVSDRAGQGLAVHALAEVCLARGRASVARDLAEQAVVLLRQAQHPGGLGEAMATLAGAHVALEDFSKAAYHAERASSVLDSAGDTAAAAAALVTASEAFRAQWAKRSEACEAEAALRTALLALKLHERLGDTTSEGYASALLARAAAMLARGGAEQALRSAEAAQAAFGGRGCAVGAAGCCLVAAEAHHRLGCDLEALACAQQARALYEQGGSRPGEALAEELAARYLRGPDLDSAPWRGEEPPARRGPLRPLLPGLERATILSQVEAHEAYFPLAAPGPGRGGGPELPEGLASPPASEDAQGPDRPATGAAHALRAPAASASGLPQAWEALYE